MADFYQEMQGVATELLTEFNQGVIKYIETAVSSDPFNPSQGADTSHTLDAVARGVEFKYVKEGYISASDIQVTASVFSVSPNHDGVVEIDGSKKQVIAVEQIPAAGTVVAWRIFCKS
jgi:hypothetical protein